MTSIGDWDEIIDDAEAERFVGREQELNTFRQQISRTPPRSLIFYITGQGGVGKTTLLNRYREIAKDFGFLLVDCDEQQRDVPAVLGRFARQLAEQGFPLKHFDERYRTYRQKLQEIENDPDAPQGLASLLVRAVVRATYIGGDLLPGIRKGLDYLPRDALEIQASEWATYLVKKLTNKDEVALVREPIPILTSLFFEDLNEIAKKQRVLFCFENFEVTRQELQKWLLQLREYKPSQNIRIAIAGRDHPGGNWDPLQKVTLTIRLDVFTEQEAEAFLDTYGIANAQRRTEVLECSARLPVLMSWLSAPEGQEPDLSVPTHDIVERFLHWVAEPTLREVALLAALPRTFNIDVLHLLLKNLSQAINEQSAFDWLQTMPFVKQGSDGWHYHEVVRRMMLRYQRQKSPQNYRQIHAILADFYNKNRHQPNSSSSEEQWSIERWRKSTLSYVYHSLVADPNKQWGEAMSLFAVALRKRRSYAVEMIELMSLDDVHNEISNDQNEMVHLLRQQLQTINDKSLQDSFQMFDNLCGIVTLSPKAKGYALAYRGECYQSKGNWEKALSDFEKALYYIPDETGIIFNQSLTYILMGHYEEALAAVNQILAVDEKNAGLVFAARGVVNSMLERYQEALSDLDHAIASNEQNTRFLMIRSSILERMGRYQEALRDLNRIIAINEQHAEAIAMRSSIYDRLGHYQGALADLDRLLALEGENANIIAIRGRTYSQLRRYQEALADLDRAVSLDEQNVIIIAIRGETYLHMRRYQEALADLDRLVTIDDKNASIFAIRGETYRQMGRYQEAL
ncbi:MAG: tetratricopeptide repeat protein, partial [Ktedonobacteraceae bacterium]